MHELITNLHLHTTYSDGSGTHAQIAKIAMECGIDVLLVTDHNVLVKGIEGYHHAGSKKVLLLIGEEIHDQTRSPQKNHLLVFNAGKELSIHARNPQFLIDQVRKADGLSFIAHPNDPPLRMFGEDDITWDDWSVSGYTGIELWNGFSELKTIVHSRLEGIFYAYFPRMIAHGPIPATLTKWDELLSKGKKVVAVGGSDAHAMHKKLGPLRRTLFPYSFHFHTINTHILTEEPLSGELIPDRKMVFDAFRQGRAFIGYDLPHPTRGFHFSAQGKEKTAWMGDEIPLGGGITLQVRIPIRAECRLVKDGKSLKVWKNRDICTFIANQPGAYRVECYLPYLGKQRGWIFSNPIYIRPND
jgi:hypothetical protein